MLIFTKGETPVFKFSVENAIQIPDLPGAPTAVISQDSLTFPLSLQKQDGNDLEFILPLESSELLVAGLETYVQLSWNDGHGGILIFPEHPVFIQDAFIDIFPDEGSSDDAFIAEDIDDIEDDSPDPDDDMFSEDGNPIDEDDDIELGDADDISGYDDDGYLNEDGDIEEDEDDDLEEEDVIEEDLSDEEID